MVEGDASPRGRDLWWGLSLLGAVAALALIYTWPTAAHWRSGIPYGYHVVPGYEMVPLMPGDQLQFLYWCWLMVDNIVGPSALLTNPYEFSTFLSPGLPGFANFPFSLLYAALYPLGQVAAYNGLVLLSYLLAGLAAYLLAREVLDSPLAAWPVGLIYALIPFRAAQVLSGHLYGFVAFLLPLMLWCLERGLKRRSWAWGAGAGACLAAMSLMEGHLVYYSALLAGAYVPLRLILDNVREQEQERPVGGAWPPVLAPVLAGVGLGLAAQLNLVRDGAAFWEAGLAEGLLAYIFLTLTAWLLLSWLTAATSRLEPDAARRLGARALAPLALAPLYGVQFWLDLPHLGSALVLALGLWGAWRFWRGWWPARRLPGTLKGLWPPVAALAVGLALAAGHMLYVKSRSFDGSIAGKGRGLDEVRLFAPSFGDLFDAANVHMEGLVFLGWVLAALALLGLILLAAGLPSKAKGAALASLWAFLGVLAALLCLGPTLPQLPLYGLLYKYLPFFNFPRVPGRLVLFAALFLALAAAWGLREMARVLRLADGKRAAVAALILGLVIAWDYQPPTATGLCLLPPPGRVEAAVRANLPTGPNSDQRLLGLPIWPGDSHQSSIYELMISRTRALTVNGYSPVVPRAYVDQVFGPLYPLDFGLPAPQALATLQRLKVGLITFHDDDLVYAKKISPFPPALARERLAASGLVEPLAQEGNVFLYRLAERPAPRDNSDVVSPVTSLWETAWLKRNTGRLVEDREASGWGLLFDEAATPDGPLGPRRRGAAGNVARALAGSDPDGYLGFGPYKAYPPGRYLARFRLRRGPGATPGRVDVATDQGQRILAAAELTPEVLPADGAWHDVALPFSLSGLEIIELRTFFNGKADLDLDLVLVNFAGQEQAAAFYPAARLWRQTGDLMPDAAVPGGLAAAARAGYHPPLYLMHGPQQTIEPGRYRAVFRLARLEDAPAPPNPDAPAVHLVAAGDLGRRPLATRLVKAGELRDGYGDFALEFSAPRRLELDLRVKYLGGASLKLAGAGLRRVD